MQRYNRFGEQLYQPVTREYCYDEEWDPKKYTHKTTLDLIGWMKNLRKKVSDLLEEEPFNAELFEKLEKRHDAIKAEVERRRAKEGKPLLDHSRKRAREWLERELTEESASSVASPSPIRPLIPNTVRDLSAEHAAHRQRIQDAATASNFTFNDE